MAESLSQNNRATCESYFRAFFDIASIGMTSVELHTGRFREVNQKFCEMTGYSRDELLTMTFSDISHPDDQEDNRSKFARLNRGEIDTYQVDKRYLCKDGRTLWVEVHAALIRDDSGKALHTIGVIIDVTARKRAEENLRESELRFRQMAENINAVFFMRENFSSTSLGKIVYISPSYEKIWGRTCQSLLEHTRSWLEAVHPDDLEKVKAALPGLVRAEFDMQFRIVHSDGEVRWVHDRVFPVRNERGEVYRSAGIVEDITEQKRAEEALRESNARFRKMAERLAESDRLKDNFLATLGHELRNPLAPISSGLDILARSNATPDQIDTVRSTMQRQVQHLIGLVDDLLDVSRISRGKMLLRKERLNLVELVHAAAEDCRSALHDSWYKWDFTLPAEPVWVDGDRTRLTQIVGNLVNNAIKFTDSGGRIAIEVCRQGDQSAKVSVSDDGVGIEPQLLARIFEPFIQADVSRQRSRGGLGLGLALVEGLARLHGGSAHAASKGPGGGSEFTVVLPLSDQRSQYSNMQQIASRQCESRRILVVEDNIDVAKTFNLLLQLMGHNVALAYNGSDALEIALKLRPEIVFCDIDLPGALSGYAVGQALRKQPDNKDSYLIAVTGYGQDEDQQRARQAGFDLHLTKPVSAATLERILASLPRGA